MGSGWIVVWLRSLLEWPLVLRHVAQVHADPIPYSGRAAHTVCQDIIHGEVGGGFRMTFFPAFEAGFGGGFVR